MQTPSARSVLSVLPKPRLVALGRDLDVAVPNAGTKETQVQTLLGSRRVQLRALLGWLKRDELKAACRAHGLDDSGRARQSLSARLLEARGGADSAPPASVFSAAEVVRHVPRGGDVVVCRHRQWLVEDVRLPDTEGEMTRVRLVCLDDDAQGRVTELLWELELGARVHRPEAHGLSEVSRLDPPRHFAAYLHALKWNAVTATDGRLFQAPFRAGIHLQAHQLTPLKKALSLPRANLFVADDVGLGKTIEAGLVLSELSLRQRVDFALVVCPASVCLQWRDEMASRFGLQFEVMSRAFIAERRKQRGFGVNPWATHRRFIISYPLLRRPEYRDPLLSLVGERTKKSLLILDEAHIAAPATARKYAVDSAVTKVVRDIAPRFENRLMLSATPHNGHSNSFSALLEILDPQRFTRGVPVGGQEQLEPVMVRRLKQDLIAAGAGGGLRFPERRVVQLGLSHRDGHWYLRASTRDGVSGEVTSDGERDLGPAAAHELGLAEELARYTDLMAPQSGRARLVFINLQKRLLSSVEAFARTLHAHARAIERAGKRVAEAELAEADSDDDAFGADDDALELEAAERVRQRSSSLPVPTGEAKAVLARLREQADHTRLLPDAKVRALVAWIAEHQCAGVQLQGPGSDRPRAGGKRAKQAGKWSERRLIVFTEYGDTKRYLLQVLQAAVAGTDQGDARIAQLHGGMGDEQRQEVQRAFNGDPARYPVRILVATDAAREGINLQAHCADLVHFDVPWNPARMEQRNGRIDRTLQPAEVVHCHYFTYAARREDPVLATLADKVQVIGKELGSLGSVVMDQLEADLEARGIDEESGARLEQTLSACTGSAGVVTVASELEQARSTEQRVKQEIEEASTILQASRKVLEFDSALLRDALDVGFELAGAGRLEAVDAATSAEDTDRPATFAVPDLGPGWQGTLDHLRPPRQRDEAPWEWRKQAPRPVTFEPPATMAEDCVHLHLAHPLVQRVLGRFLAQGYSSHDLSRVTVLQNRHDALVRVIAFGRLSLFGRGATRLHDEVLSVAARWVEGQPLRPFAEEGDRRAITLLEQTLAQAPRLERIPKRVQARVTAAAADLFGQLWPSLREEADARAVASEELLKARGRGEADALRSLLDRQKAAIKRRMRQTQPPQPPQPPQQAQRSFSASEREEQRQLEADLRHMQGRLENLARERDTEPGEIETLYAVALKRLSPVGLVVLWPKERS